MQQDPSSQEYADEVARLRASESDSDAELLVRFDIFYRVLRDEFMILTMRFDRKT